MTRSHLLLAKAFSPGGIGPLQLSLFKNLSGKLKIA